MMIGYVRCSVHPRSRTRPTSPFPKLTKLKPSEIFFFSYIAYKSRAHRDKVNAKVMSDPRIAKMMGPNAMPFDVKRTAYGGSEALVDL